MRCLVSNAAASRGFEKAYISPAFICSLKASNGVIPRITKTKILLPTVGVSTRVTFANRPIRQPARAFSTVRRCQIERDLW